MNTLRIPGTKSTPDIKFNPDSGSLIIKGHSYPENAFKFYEPILQWVDAYLENLETSAAISIELELPYLNTSSTKCFMILLEKFDEAFRSGKHVGIRWYYQPEDENELECAEEFKEDLALPFELIPKEAH